MSATIPMDDLVALLSQSKRRQWWTGPPCSSCRKRWQRRQRRSFVAQQHRLRADADHIVNDNETQQYGRWQCRRFQQYASVTRSCSYHSCRCSCCSDSSNGYRSYGRCYQHHHIHLHQPHKHINNQVRCIINEYTFVIITVKRMKIKPKYYKHFVAFINVK